MPSRLSIDTLRGAACLLLVAFHVIGSSMGNGLRLPTDHLASQVNDWLSVIRMPLFSFLSGLVYAHRPLRGGFARFASGKARRLLVPLLTVGTAFAALQALTPGANAVVPDWRLVHVVPVAHYWFLEALFWVFMATALLERGGLLATPGRFALVGLAAAILQLDAPLPIHFGLQGATYLLPYFLLGVAACRYHTLLTHTHVATAAAVLVAVAAMYWSTLPPFRLAESQTPMELAASVGSCLLLLHLRPQFQALAWIGRWSFGIYLFHAIFAASTRILLKNLGVDSLPVLFAMGLAAGLAGPILLTALLRRVPLGHWLLGERQKRAPTQQPGLASALGGA